MPKIIIPVKAFYFLFIPLLIAGCDSYRKAVEVKSEEGSLSKSKYVKKLIAQGYYLVVHHGNNQWHIKNLIQDSTGLWNAEAEAVDTSYDAFYLKADSKKGTRFHEKEVQFIQQAHLFINDPLIISPGNLKFDLASAKIEILKSKDYVGIPITLGLFFGLIILGILSLQNDHWH